MEEYKKKLFMNYLKSEIANRKNNKIFKNLKKKKKMMKKKRKKKKKRKMVKNQKKRKIL